VPSRSSLWVSSLVVDRMVPYALHIVSLRLTVRNAAGKRSLLGMHKPRVTSLAGHLPHFVLSQAEEAKGAAQETADKAGQQAQQAKDQVGSKASEAQHTAQAKGEKAKQELNK
jgi:hypothetical protein